MTPNFVRDLRCAALYPCGSRVTCDPPPEDTDEDWLILFYDQTHLLDALDRLVNSLGFTNESDFRYGSRVFYSVRRDELNLLLTADPEFYARHRRATALCKLLNIANKEDRVAVFQVILYDKEYEL